MPLKFGDAVVLVQKSPDGIVRRVNAMVLTSAVQPSNPNPSQALKDHKGVLDPGEYLGLIFPRAFPEGQVPKTSDLDVLFQRTVGTGPWKDGAWIGWESSPRQDDMKGLLDAYEKATGLLAEMRQQNELLTAELAAVKESEPEPTEEAQEAEAKATAAGKVRQIKGK